MRATTIPRAGVLAAALLALSIAPASAQEKPALPRWETSLATGLAAAKERGVALMVALNMDKERGNQQMVDEVYTDPVFIEAAEKCAVAIGSLFKHRLVADKKSGRQACERFGSVTCDEHRAIEDTVRREWLGLGPKDDVDCPRHFFLSPDGKILFQRVWTMKAEDLAALMTRASELCTPERLASWDTLEGRLERAFDPISAVRDIALAELIAENDPEIDAELAKRAKSSKDADIAGSVLGAFALAEPADRRALSHAALKHKAPAVRMRTAFAMRRSGFEDHLAPLLARVGKEKDEKAKSSICRALGALGPENTDVRKALTKALADKKELVREQASVAVAPFATEKSVQTALLKILPKGGSQDVRAAATWALGFSESKEVKSALIDYRDTLGRWDWRLETAVNLAIKRLSDRDVPEYDGLPARYFPDPAEGEKPKWPGRGRGGR